MFNWIVDDFRPCISNLFVGLGPLRMPVDDDEPGFNFSSGGQEASVFDNEDQEETPDICIRPCAKVK